MNKEFGELGNLLTSSVNTDNEKDKQTVESFLLKSYGKFGSKYESAEGKDKEELKKVILGKFETYKKEA